MQSNTHSFLTSILPALLPHERIELRAIPPDRSKPLIRRFSTDQGFLLREAFRLKQTHHLYVGVCLRRGTDGTANGVSRARTCWADIDAKLWRSPTPQQDALTAIQHFVLLPSVVVDTGGGYHVYWCLDTPVDLHLLSNRTRLERLNAALARAVCGPDRQPDPVQDVARVLRLPGSLNHKYAPPRSVTVIWYAPDRRYALNDLERVLTERFPWAVPSRMNPRSSLVASPLAQSRAMDFQHVLPTRHSRRPILRLLAKPGAAGYRSASEADAAIATALLGSGLTEQEALRVLISSPRGQDAFVRKGERYAPRYWHRTVMRAAEYVQQSR